jgi:hypothetical protein
LAAATLGATLFGRRVEAAPTLTDGARMDVLQPASPESVFFRAEGPHKPFSGGVEFAAGATFEYGKGLVKETRVFVDGSKQTVANLVEHAVLARVGGSITPLHWLSFDLSLPFALFEKGDAPTALGSDKPKAAKAPGLGDLRIGVHFRPIDTPSFGLILGGRFWAPFGTPESYLSDHRLRGEVDLGVAGESSRLLWGCTVSVAPTFFARRSGDRMGTSCALHVALGDSVSLGIEPTFALVTHTDSYPFAAAGSDLKNDGKASLGVLVEPLGAFRLRLANGFRLGVAAGPGFGGGMGNAEVRALLNLAYVGLGKPPKPVPQGPPDRDLDKIPDSEDACPDEAGPPSRDPKTNGCPAHDRDGDGIRDEEDYCPDRPGVPHPDPKANGCPDSDNDGLPDPIDQCVNEPGPGPSGCPKHARLATGAFKIDPGIDFVGDKLNATSRASFEEVAATMRANPKIAQISIALGTKGVRPGVSDKRAQDILGVLRAANLDANRFEVVLRDDLKGGVVQVKIK